MTPTSDDLSDVNLHAVLHSLPDGVTLANADGRIVFSNAAADRILGVGAATGATPDEWTEHYGVFLPDGETPFPTDRYPLVRALRGEVTDGVEMVVRSAANPDGAVISVSGQPLLETGGQRIGAAVVFRDITELRHVQRELEEANLHLRSVQDMKNELVSFVAHDIKNPLSIIVATCGLLDRANQLSPEQQEDVDGIRAAAHRINRMVLDMIDLQLAEDGALQLNVQTIEVRDLMQEVARSLIVRMGRAHQRLSVGTADGLAIRGDRSLLFRLIINLADNCLKYGPPDGQIRISAWRSTGDRVAIAVSDEGPGVPEHMRDRIFDRYAKGERLDGQRSADSRGLGLRFCSVMAEAHGGTVWVEDAEPHGARFCVALPAG